MVEQLNAHPCFSAAFSYMFANHEPFTPLLQRWICDNLVSYLIILQDGVHEMWNRYDVTIHFVLVLSHSPIATAYNPAGKPMSKNAFVGGGPQGVPASDHVLRDHAREDGQSCYQ